MDAKGSFYPDRSVSRAEIAALLTRVVKPETRLTLTWTVAPYHSVKNATLASLVKAPAATSLPTSAKDTASIDGLVRNMLARGEHTITLNYSKALTTATASALTQAFTSCVKTYCEQMYNAVSCRSYSTGKVVLTFSSTACTDKTLESYRAKALAAAIKVHDSLWESGTLSYDMSQYEIARTYFQWLCDHCRYDNAAADDSREPSCLRRACQRPCRVRRLHGRLQPALEARGASSAPRFLTTATSGRSRRWTARSTTSMSPGATSTAARTCATSA